MDTHIGEEKDIFDASGEQVEEYLLKLSATEEQQ
jgi:hypothetical protein